ncbi:MAG: hypothetical protein AAB444_01220 [Patescibacteria group bacterium]
MNVDNIHGSLERDPKHDPGVIGSRIAVFGIFSLFVNIPGTAVFSCPSTVGSVDKRGQERKGKTKTPTFASTRIELGKRRIEIMESIRRVAMLSWLGFTLATLITTSVHAEERLTISIYPITMVAPPVTVIEFDKEEAEPIQAGTWMNDPVIAKLYVGLVDLRGCAKISPKNLRTCMSAMQVAKTE